MGAAFDDTAVGDDHDARSVLDRGQPMGDDERGAAGHQVIQAPLQGLFGLRVDAGGCLVQDQDARVGQQHAGKRDQLLFTGRHARSLLIDHRLVALRQAHDEIMGADGPGGFDAFVVGGVEPAVADILQDRSPGTGRDPAA